MSQIQEKIEEFNAKSDFVKYRSIIAAESFFKNLEQEQKILDSMHGKGWSVVAVINDYAILSNGNTYTSSILENGKWIGSPNIWPSVDFAILAVIGEKQEGANSRFAYYAGKMIFLNEDFQK